VLTIAALFTPLLRSDDSFADVADEVNKKVVKLFGAGGIRGLHSYGTGILINSKGHILTVNSHILDTRDLRIHLYDGTRVHGKVVAREPELDIALIYIDEKVDIDHYFDVEKAAKMPHYAPGTGILGFSNQFQIATRDEAVSVQQGRIASFSKLAARVGVFEAAYRNEVYIVDAITNNPGAGGGVITTRKGELVALIGKELRNELTNTWLNYGVPMSATAEATGKDGKKMQTNILKVIAEGPNYNPLPPKPKDAELKVFHGIIFVPNVVERTPPYVEEVVPGSPADAAKLKPDDLIIYIDGIPTPDINTLNNVLATYQPNREVKFEVQRSDKVLSVELKLAKLPEKKKKD